MKAVNLLPEGERRRRPSGGRAGSAYVLVGVLASVLVMAVVYALTSNQASSRTATAAEARQETAALQQRISALSPFGDFAQVKATRLTSVRQLAAGRFDWERLVRELSRVLPSDSWLQSVNASATGAPDSSSGSSASSSSTAATGQPSAQLVGCTRHQSDVAALMVRLRKVYRVQDVSLNQSGSSSSSSSGGSSSAGGSGDCGHFDQFDVTVSFSALPSVQDAPHGAKRVPASLGGGS